MKIKFLLVVFAFLVICLKPVGAVNTHDNETEISCYVDSQDCEVVTIDILIQSGEYAERVEAYKGFTGSTAEEARPPNLEISKVYYTTIFRTEAKESNLFLLRKARDGLTERV